MSSKKYIEQFDKNAGKPADFDSLFRFDGDDITAKKKIRRRVNKGYIYTTASAAAVFIAVVVLRLGVLGNGDVTSEMGMAELAQMSLQTYEETTALTEYIEQETSEYKLSELIGKNNYSLSGTYGLNYEIEPAKSYSLNDSAVLLHCKIVSKQEKILNDIDLFAVEYSYAPIDYYTKALDYTPDITLTNSFIVYRPIDQTNAIEYQIGGEYYVPLEFSDELSEVASSGVTLPNVPQYYNVIHPIMKTSTGWLIDSRIESLTANTLPINNDIDNYFNDYPIMLEPSDDYMAEKIASLIGSSEVFEHTTVTNSVSDIFTVSLSDVFSSQTAFESVKYADESKEVLILDNKNYFELKLKITGDVSFAGANIYGENTVSINVEDKSVRTIIFTGFESLTVDSATTIYPEELIGTCNENPLYLQCFDNNGNPVIISIE